MPKPKTMICSCAHFDAQPTADLTWESTARFADARSPTSPTRSSFRKSGSMTMPASPTGCAPRAKPPKRSRRPTAARRAALYRALGRAYDFAIAAERDPDDYAELLEESGVKAQARAPMTPIVKLVFGIDYDKTRLTEFAAALSYAQRTPVPLGGFDALDRRPVRRAQGARRRRAPGAPPRARARHARPKRRATHLRAIADPRYGRSPGDEEFLPGGRPPRCRRRASARSPGGDPALLDRAIRRTA